MASATDIHKTIAIHSALAGTVRVDGDTVRVEPPAARQQIYYLLWRNRPSHPWHSEEFTSRIQAHRRFFSLIERGVEAYLEKRQPGRPE